MDGTFWKLSVTLPEPDLGVSEHLSLLLREQTPIRWISGATTGVEAGYPTQARALDAMVWVREECPEARCVVERES